jgi:hypothetical protein
MLSKDPRGLQISKTDKSNEGPKGRDRYDGSELLDLMRLESEGGRVVEAAQKGDDLFLELARLEDDGGRRPEHSCPAPKVVSVAATAPKPTQIEAKPVVEAGKSVAKISKPIDEATLGFRELCQLEDEGGFHIWSRSAPLPKPNK